MLKLILKKNIYVDMAYNGNLKKRLKNLEKMRGDSYDYGKFKRGGTVGYTQRWKKARGK